MSPRRYWNDEEVALLLQLRMDDVSHAAIAKVLGRTEHSCHLKLAHIDRVAQRRAELIAAGIEPKRQPNGWSEEECADLIRMRELERMGYEAIGAKLNRGAKLCALKYRTLRPLPDNQRKKSKKSEPTHWVPQAQIIDRDARKVLAHRSLTSAFFGDPLPGRSALDRRSATA